MVRIQAQKARTSSRQRMQEKRARDRGLVWDEGNIKALSDTGLLEQVAYAFRRERELQKQGGKGYGVTITRALIRELERRLP
ncbi:MAG: hypothetical protein ACYCXT_00160 [Acidiferrobacteraceae bacterium]